MTAGVSTKNSTYEWNFLGLFKAKCIKDRRARKKANCVKVFISKNSLFLYFFTEYAKISIVPIETIAGAIVFAILLYLSLNSLVKF